MIKKVRTIIIALAIVIGFIAINPVAVYAYPSLPGVGGIVYFGSGIDHRPYRITKINQVKISKTNDWTDSLIVYCYEFEEMDSHQLVSWGIGSVISFDTGVWYADDCFDEEDDAFNRYATLSKGEINDLMEYYSIRWVSQAGKDGLFAEEYVDRDTYKTCLPARTVIANVPGNPKQLYELKVHPMSEKDIANQRLLVQAFSGNQGGKTSILAEYGIFPRRDLSTNEKGLNLELTWKELEKNRPGEVMAVCYNQTDGAYLIKGYIDENGKAVFNGYKLYEATNITIFRCL